MILGLIAVFSAIVYKLGDTAPAASFSEAAGFGSAPIEATLALPAGARIVSADLDGGRALLLVETPDGDRSLVLLALASGKILGRYAPIEE